MPEGHVTGNGEQSAVVDVVTEVAERSGTDVTALPPVYEVIDPEAFDTLVETGNARVEFAYCGYDVVAEDGSITIRGDLDDR